MGQIEDEEIAKALRYRQQWSNRIAFRANQIRALAGQPEAYKALWEKYKKMYDTSAYIPGEPDTEFFTPYDIEGTGAASRSYLELPGTKQSRRTE